jgi:hypothetical protein
MDVAQAFPVGKRMKLRCPEGPGSSTDRGICRPSFRYVRPLRGDLSGRPDQASSAETSCRKSSRLSTLIASGFTVLLGK